MLFRSVVTSGSVDVGLATSGLVTNLLAFFGEFERELTVETADSVPRYYRCRGSVAYPACQPAVQVPAREVEEAVIARLRQPSSIRGAPPLIRLFLGWIDDLWERLDRRGKNVFVQAFVHGATWHPENRRVTVELDLEMIAPLAEAEAQRRREGRELSSPPQLSRVPPRPRRRRAQDR